LTDATPVTKTCPGCGTVFTLQQIVSNSEVLPIGMQIVESGRHMYFFTHACSACGSTFVVPVLAFLPFLTEPVPDTPFTGTEVCDRHCMRIDDLSRCYAPCRYAPFRRFLLQIRKEQRAPASGSGSSR
jgi:hypothetical protein